MSKKISGAARGAKKAPIHAASEQPAASAAIVRFTFDTDELEVIREGGRLFTTVRGVCVALGVHITGQLARLRTDPVVSVEMISTEVDVGASRAQRTLACIEVRLLPLWLARINPNKVRPELRPKLLRYQLEAAEVLAEHFLGRRAAPAAPSALPPAEPAPEPPPAASSPDPHREAALELLGPGLDARVVRALICLPSPRRSSVRYWLARAQELHDLVAGARQLGGFAAPPRSPSEALEYAERLLDLLERELAVETPAPYAEGTRRGAELALRWVRDALFDAAVVRSPAERERHMEARVRLTSVESTFARRTLVFRKEEAAPGPVRALPRRGAGGSGGSP